MVASATATTKGQFLVSAKMNVSSLENRWRRRGGQPVLLDVAADLRARDATPDDAQLDMKFNHFRIYDKYYKQVQRNVFLGAGYTYNVHNNVRPDDDVAPGDWLDSPYVAYSRSSSASTRLPDLRRRQPARPRRQPRRRHQPEPGLVRERVVPDALRGFPRRHLELAAAQLRPQDLRAACDGRAPQARLLDVRRPRDRREAPYLDLPTTGGDTVRALGTRLPPGAVPRRGDALRRGGVPLDDDANGLFGMVAFVNTETLRTTRRARSCSTRSRPPPASASASCSTSAPGPTSASTSASASTGRRACTSGCRKPSDEKSR